MKHDVKTIHEHKLDIVRFGKMMYDRRFIVAGEGNISVRLEDGIILATPTMLCKGMLSPDQIVKLDLAGNPLERDYLPSSEIKMHLAAYRTRPDIKAVVHAHPPISTGFAVAGVSLDQPILAEIVVNFGTIPIAPYASPSTEELAESVAEKARCYDAVLMANHGVITMGPDITTAYHRMEMVEQFATISLVAHILGRANTFSDQQLSDLIALREKAGIGSQNPYRAQCPLPGQSQPDDHTLRVLGSKTPSNNMPDMEALVNVITQTVMSVIRGR